nr:MAG TPA: hypothetical protein [Caudoviricetes sp.]
MKMKAIQIILEGLKVVFISFVIALIVLFVDERNFLHVILSVPIVLILLYILVEKSFISNKQNKEKQSN